MEKLLKRGKIDFEICYNLAISFINTGDLEAGKENLKKCISLEPENPVARRDLGILYLKMNYMEWALDELKTAIKLEPENPENYFNYAVALNNSQNFTKADEYFKKAVDLNNDNADYYLYRGENLLATGKNDEAEENLKTALRLSPDNCRIKFALAKIYFEKKKYSISKDLLIDVAGNDNSPETLNLLAKSYAKLKDFKSAAGIFNKLAKTYPNNHILLTELAKCQLKLGAFQNAKENAKKALMIFSDFEDAIKVLKEAQNNEPD